MAMQVMPLELTVAQACASNHMMRMLCCDAQANKRWKGLEMRLTDAANEAKDNVRYLATLDQPFEVRL